MRLVSCVCVCVCVCVAGRWGTGPGERCGRGRCPVGPSSGGRANRVAVGRGLRRRPVRSSSGRFGGPAVVIFASVEPVRRAVKSVPGSSCAFRRLVLFVPPLGQFSRARLFALLVSAFLSFSFFLCVFNPPAHTAACQGSG